MDDLNLIGAWLGSWRWGRKDQVRMNIHIVEALGIGFRVRNLGLGSELGLKGGMLGQKSVLSKFLRANFLKTDRSK